MDVELDAKSVSESLMDDNKPLQIWGRKSTNGYDGEEED